MQPVQPDESWPKSWKESYPYDLDEVYGKISNYGYAYAYQNRRFTAGHVKTEALLRVTPRVLVNAFETVTQTLPVFSKRKALVQLAVRFRKT